MSSISGVIVTCLLISPILHKVFSALLIATTSWEKEQFIPDETCNEFLKPEK